MNFKSIKTKESIAMPLHTLITGGLQGIGKSIAELLHARGDRVSVFDIAPENDERVRALKQAGIDYHTVDVASVYSIKQGFDKLDGTIDILVNNAGITRDNLALRITEKEWDSVLEVNLKGAFFCAQQALKKMIRQSKSYIINISSVVGLHGNPGQVNYAASKAGIIGMTKTLAHEYAKRNILVNAIAPGFIQTPMTEKLSEHQREKALEHIALKRLGTPEDIAHLVAFLTSGNADYITGQVIEVAGGMR